VANEDLATNFSLKQVNVAVYSRAMKAQRLCCRTDGPKFCNVIGRPQFCPLVHDLCTLFAHEALNIAHGVILCSKLSELQQNKHL
jgi:hypothetical protein